MGLSLSAALLFWDTEAVHVLHARLMKSIITPIPPSNIGHCGAGVVAVCTLYLAPEILRMGLCSLPGQILVDLFEPLSNFSTCSSYHQLHFLSSTETGVTSYCAVHLTYVAWVRGWEIETVRDTDMLERINHSPYTTHGAQVTDASLISTRFPLLTW